MNLYDSITLLEQTGILNIFLPFILIFVGRYPPESDPVLLINNVLPNISLIMLAVIAFMLIVGVFGHNVKIGEKGTLTGIVMIVSALAVLFTFGIAANWFGQLPWWLRFLEDPSTQTLFIVILVTGIILAIITGGGKDGDNDPETRSFAKMFKGSLGSPDDK